MSRKVLIGTVTVSKDVVKHNNEFQYAASFEDIMVSAGEYKIFTHESDLRKMNGKTHLGWRNYIEYKGTVVRGNIGNKIGDPSEYCMMVYDYILAEHFLNGHDYDGNVSVEYTLRPEWDLEVSEGEFDGKRHFSMSVVLKDGQQIPCDE